MRKGCIIGIFLILFAIPVGAQEPGITWLSFEQLEDSLAVKPRKVMISFYADWCVYCKKMDRAAFRDPEVVETLTEQYYAVRMNAESRDTIVFDGVSYSNKQLGKKRNSTHEIPLLLASRENYPFSLPAIVLLDEQFMITSRHFEYLSPEQMKNILKTP
ncbi:Thioredoxin-like [Robiginitalea myxolifaciens]|uniref:Thioredoxin-like n=1 Tax=Robiginitalea myxolifaciens TaxID=400055 RepID=A0A1I6FYS7_9FLAO|nr:thioredoxin family protein [Robiginitalea myxolifaciens]SFR35061.1 Thioredoxin-like [Robiginitalea myxolifaciens]